MIDIGSWSAGHVLSEVKFLVAVVELKVVVGAHRRLSRVMGARKT